MKTTTDFKEYAKENEITKKEVNFGFDVDYKKRLERYNKENDRI